MHAADRLWALGDCSCNCWPMCVVVWCSNADTPSLQGTTSLQGGELFLLNPKSSSLLSQLSAELSNTKF